jgi:hypothetical protein
MSPAVVVPSSTEEGVAEELMDTRVRTSLKEVDTVVTAAVSLV